MGSWMRGEPGKRLPGEPLLHNARSLAAAFGVEKQVRTFCADLDGIPAAGLGVFEVVLCHNVLQYREDVASTRRDARICRR